MTLARLLHWLGRCGYGLSARCDRAGDRLYSLGYRARWRAIERRSREWGGSAWTGRDEVPF